MSVNNRYSKYEPLFGSWYINKEIGKGAIGEVYEIERNDLGTTYKAALKAITIPEGEDDIKRAISSGVQQEDLVDYYRNLVRNISTEFQYLAKLKGNSYIVNYEDHIIMENESDLRWDILIKTELLTPLVEHAMEHPLRESDVLKLGIDICRALKFCSQFNIIHRDIKPENIFIGPSGDYKLGDFGIARVVEQTQYNLSRKGTYTYMSPEVFHGEAYGQAADIYSLGLVMYKYLNHGRIPFMPAYPKKIKFNDAENAFADRMSGKVIPDPATGSPKLRKIVLKACSYDPLSRYSTAEEMLVDLETLYLHSKKKETQRWNFEKRIQQESESRKPDTKKVCRRIVTESQPANGMKKSYLIASLVLILLMTLVATYISIPKKVTDIEGIDSEISMYYDGTLKPEYTIEPSWFKDEPIKFKSSDENVFYVDANGVLTAVSIGEADLTVKAKDYSETAHVRIVPKVTDIKGLEDSYILTEGDELTLSPVLKPDKFANEPIRYKVKNKDVATVDKDGHLTAVKVGETTLTVKAGGSKTKVSIIVNPKPVIIQYRQPSSSSGGSSKKSSKKNSGGYFDSGDDEYF